MDEVEKILANLPQVTIDRLPEEERGIAGSAHCDRLPDGYEGGVVDIVADAKVIGLDVEGSTEGLAFSFTFEPWVHKRFGTIFLKPGSTYPSTPWRLRNDVRVAVERRTNWVGTKFKPTDAYQRKDDPRTWAPLIDGGDSSGYRVRPAASDTKAASVAMERPTGLGPYDPDRHDVIRGGWDHEHCDMCLGTIDTRRPSCYTNADGAWLCEGCYEKYVTDGCLDFLAGYASESGRH